MNSKEYWRKREEEALEKYQKSEAEYDKEIKRIYSNMLADCQTQINAFYGRYADKEGITLAEAKKRVKKADIADFERKAARYVKDKDFSAKANEEMRLYNTMMKINRFEMLKANIGLEMIKGHDELEKFMSGVLKGRTEEELARQAGILGKTVRNNAQLAHAIPNASFHNATFSDRVWAYHDIMKADLEKLLTSGLIQGKNPRQLAKSLEKYVMGDAKGGAKYNAERLMRTELARVQTEAQKQSFIRNGFDKYIFIVNAGCCGHCEEVADKDSGYGKGVYLVKDMQPGLNAPPLHPQDRCSTAAYSDRKEYDEWLDFLEKGGTTAEFNKLKDVKTNISGLKKPIRPKRSNFESVEEYEKAKEQYKSENEVYNKRFNEVLQQTLNRKPVFKNKDEVFSRCKKSGISIDDDVFKSIDIKALSEVISTLEEMFEKYPSIKSYTIENQNGEMLKTRFNIGLTDEGMLSANGGFNFNARYFKNYEIGLSEGLGEMTTGYLVRGDGTFSTLVRHEYGHNVQTYIEQSIAQKYHHNVDDWKLNFKSLDEWKTSEEAYYKERKAYENDLISLSKLNGVSEYAQTNTFELFAEGFAEYTSGGTTAFGSAFGDFLERWYK